MVPAAERARAEAGVAMEAAGRAEGAAGRAVEATEMAAGTMTTTKAVVKAMAVRMRGEVVAMVRAKEAVVKAALEKAVAGTVTVGMAAAAAEEAMEMVVVMVGTALRSIPPRCCNCIPSCKIRR